MKCTAVIILCATLSSFSIFSMNQERQKLPYTGPMREIASPINNPTHVACISNVKVAIGGSNGLAFVHLFAEKCSHHQSQSTIQDLCVNNSISKLAVSAQGVITVYDTATEQKEWEYKTASTYVPITFNSQKEDELFTCELQEYLALWKDGKNITSKKIFPIQPFSPIVCLPHKSEILYFTKENGCSVLILHKDDANPLRLDCHSNFVNVEASKDARYILYNTHNLGFKLAVSNNFAEHLVEIQHYVAIGSVHCIQTFHPNSEYFIELQHTPTEYFLYYQKCNLVLANSYNPKRFFLQKSNENAFSQIKKTSKRIVEKRLAFSPNGSVLIMALADKCFIRSVIFDLNYYAVKNIGSLLFLIYTLNQCDKETTLPLLPEIINLIKQLLIKLHQSQSLL